MKKQEHLENPRKNQENIHFKVDGLVLWLIRQLSNCSLAGELPHVSILFNPVNGYKRQEIEQKRI